MISGFTRYYKDVTRFAVLAGCTLYVLATAGRGAPSNTAIAQPQHKTVAPDDAATIASTDADNAKTSNAPTDYVTQTAADKGASKVELAIPVSGSGIESLDQIVIGTMRTRRVPGAALAICKDGQLLVMRSYGWSNLATHEALTPDSLFSLAGVSKVITATAILKLVEEKKLSLDDHVYSLLGKPQAVAPATIDPHFEQITVRHLLLQSGGWNEKENGDPMYMPAKIARKMHEKLPLARDTLVRYGVSLPLDFAPGTKARHSNFGYYLARLVIEKASGQTYENYVRQNVLKPIGVMGMRLERFAPEYAANEVHRYDAQNLELPGGHTPIAAPHGSWLASAADMSRLMMSLNNTAGNAILTEKSLSEMFAMPEPPLAARKGKSHVGLGWDSVVGEGASVGATAGSATAGSAASYRAATYHTAGAAPGVRALMEHRARGITWMLLMNSDGFGADQSSASKALIEQMRSAIDQVTAWPQQIVLPTNTLAGPMPKPILHRGPR